MATLTSNISSVSLAVSGNTQKSTNISWTLPSVPSGSTISSCVLTGTAAANMSKGSATITVNGSTVSSGSSFTVNLGTSNTTSSVTATAKGGNKNASGTVTFSNLVYTVTYTEPVITYAVTFVDWNGAVLKTETVNAGGSATAPSIPSRFGYTFTGWDISFSNVSSNLTITAQYESVSVLEVKESGNWVNIGRLYKKVSGSWVEQANDVWANLFSSDIRYMRKEIPIVPTAILYSDGALVFSNDNSVDSSHGDVIASYTGWDSDIAFTGSNIPWKSDTNNIKSVYFNNIKPTKTVYWFNYCLNLTNFDSSGLDTGDVTSMSYMFSNCSGLTSLDLSSFNTSDVTSMRNMFNNCSSLTTLDLSSFDISNVTNMSNMFYGCTNPNLIIYVKDDATKTKIEASTNFPTTATVVVGSMN